MWNALRNTVIGAKGFKMAVPGIGGTDGYSNVITLTRYIRIGSKLCYGGDFCVINNGCTYAPMPYDPIHVGPCDVQGDQGQYNHHKEISVPRATTVIKTLVFVLFQRPMCFRATPYDLIRLGPCDMREDQDRWFISLRQVEGKLKVEIIVTARNTFRVLHR